MFGGGFPVRASYSIPDSPSSSELKTNAATQLKEAHTVIWGVSGCCCHGAPCFAPELSTGMCIAVSMNRLLQAGNESPHVGSITMGPLEHQTAGDILRHARPPPSHITLPSLLPGRVGSRPAISRRAASFIFRDVGVLVKLVRGGTGNASLRVASTSVAGTLSTLLAAQDELSFVAEFIITAPTTLYWSSGDIESMALGGTTDWPSGGFEWLGDGGCLSVWLIG